MLTRPDERTLAAIARLRADVDFMEFTAWLEHSVNELDHANRTMMDGVLLRQQQGAAQALAGIIERVQGKTPAGAIAKPIPLYREAG